MLEKFSNIQVLVNKPMDYTGSGKSELIYLSTLTVPDFGTAKVAVVNTRGSHPCTYVQFAEVEDMEVAEDGYCFVTDEGWDSISNIDINFLGHLSKNVGLNGKWLGWDYCHYGQWFQSCPPDNDPFSHEGEEMYSTEECARDAYAYLAVIRHRH